MLTAYGHRLYPKADQQIMLAKHFGSCRFVWNYFLDLINRGYTETGKGSSYKQMCADLTKLKKEDDYKWLREVNSQSLQHSLMHLETAYRRFFRKLAEPPVFKGKHNRQSFTVSQRFRVEDNKLFIPNLMEPIRMFRHREYDGDVRNITISQEPSGKYYASILVLEADPDVQQMPKADESAIGIDVGLVSFATLSDGTKIEKPKHLVQSEKKLKKAQRRLSRKKKGSHNRREQRVKIARIQDHIADAGWYIFMEMLKTTASRRGKNYIEIGRFEPSTKTCSNCGYTNDRDVNAAINIKRFALISEGVPTESGELKLKDFHDQ